MRWNRKGWAGLAPNGIGQQKPNHYLEMVKVGWANRRNRNPTRKWS